MPVPFDELQPFSFNGFAFPYSSYRVTGGIRKHNHEYPHNPGAAVEKLGRALYEIQVSVNFTGGLIDPRYNALLSSLDAVRVSFEDQITAPLNIPHIGVIQACADKWSESAHNRNRSTIQADFTFFEDLNSALQLRDQVTVSTVAIASLASKFAELAKPLAPVFSPNSFEIKPIGPNSISIWDAINDLSVTIAGMQDQQELFGALLSSKIEGVVALFKQADTSIASLNDPDNFLVLDAMHALWEACIDLQADLQNTGFRAQIFMTPTRMGIADVSVAIYGNSLSAAQLMQLNEFDDPLSIPAFTQVIYYPALQSAAA